ncbi:pre-rRNA processing protein FTSJ3 [Seriola lalandi dorsalis]|uniref:pre-rRNA processing protein FTSJ3 n=2 Tax=Seriola lalandi dorsalis TaxID=1841481 RepID=A0A3B4Y158_SERLL|nr:pre-rRNA processing protein FTSJ3 [Seriola lalandi dorsalis]XP_056235491.1 pre-rRNA 2'-O-ribose RNA methyltransferase FTSJ3 [Seriola aureovittata]
MGKKLKVGKTRKDKFYHLAKETGYRSRSSFKLIQLNRKFTFLQKARALVDLCAAPGGWLQVASKFMPISSLIIGVDLVPIKPIPNVVTLQEDITTEKCRQALRKELQTWKVDVVLNDGAPNVGANWQHDAFSQAHLTLMALKLACEFLTKGGTFVTKVFRSKDYQPLLWIFQQFFKKVQATKPQASRNESAEIFVICQGFVAPDKIDGKFFDPKHAFKEVEVQAKTVRELIPVKKPKAEGYTDGDLTLYHSFTVTSFLKADNAVDFLGKASEITFDNPDLESHSATSLEIKECCRDIKVLGRKELRLLLNWRSKLRRYLARKLKQEAKQLDQQINLSSDEDGSNSEEEPDKKKVEGEGEEEMDADEEEEMERKLAEMKAEEVADLKRKKRKLLKERRKQRERVELKMDLPGVSIADGNDSSLFSLTTVKKQKALADISKGDMQAADTLLDEEDDLHLSEEEDDDADKMSLASDLDEEDMEEVEHRQKALEKKAPKKKVQFAEEEEEDEGQESGLLVELEGKDEKKERETSLWFSKGIFSEIDLEGDAESELQQTEWLQSKQTGKAKKRKAEEEEGVAETAQPEEEKAGPSQGAVEESDSDSDDSSDDEKEITRMKQARGAGGTSGEADADDFQVVPVESTSKKARILDAEGLALGCQIATSKKRARDLVDSSFHRFANSDEAWEVPEWFLDDERKHRKKPVPVTKEMVEEYKQKWKEIDSRPIKRVAEAKARKKRRMLKKMEQAKKKAEAVVNTVDISEREKMAQLKSIYKKAGVGKEKREVTYVVSKKGAGKKVRRPPGVKGVFKVVDSRMKKDMRGMQRKDQHAKGGKGKGGKGKGRPSKGGKGGMKGGKGRKGK